MRHAYLYNGAFELNYSGLRAGTSTYKTVDGAEHPLPTPSGDIDGVRFGYMEKAGRKFYVVRVQYGSYDIVLENPIAIDRMRHVNNRRLKADPLIATDDEASTMLDDIIRDNPDKHADLAMMLNQINQVRRAKREKSGAE